LVILCFDDELKYLEVKLLKDFYNIDSSKNPVFKFIIIMLTTILRQNVFDYLAITLSFIWFMKNYLEVSYELAIIFIIKFICAMLQNILYSKRPFWI